ncbi:TPA: hypothetical protein RQO14_000783 [Klebsiella michiganensis]|nr:hypothetical protein [Klebsiella pneumoniae]MCA5482384.1 hypothetical protein [Klebsiella pneumoniae]MCA5541077.1 hypothetical protein [Klebsiella pneumoniae]HDX8952781.1 hypothetical protein [Klebsiella michiganensis]
MTKHSYPNLISVTVAALTAIFLFVWWRVTIYRVTFLNTTTSLNMILSSVAVSFFLSVLLVSNGGVKDGKVSSYLKLYSGITMVMAMLSIIPVMTIAYLLPGPRSSYTAPYEYASGRSNSCSGADVEDPDLKKNIRICYPDGGYSYGNIIYVEKRSNFLGAVVTYAAAIFPDSDQRSII